MNEILKDEQSFDVFISYRRETGFYMAYLLYQKLSSNGYTVFMDMTMHSGKYETKIQYAIEHCKNYLLVLLPDDIAACCCESSWLNKEATCAVKCGSDLTIIPVMCDDFKWDVEGFTLTDVMSSVSENNGIFIHKDQSISSDFDNLCNNFLKNTNPAKPKITATEFFKYNIETRTDMIPREVDAAFHVGSPWLMHGPKNTLFINSLKRGIRWRVLINTVEAAESIGQHMRDDDVWYTPFHEMHSQWKKLATKYSDVLEVRECRIPLIHVHHCIKLQNAETGKSHGEMHIRYYAYNNTRPDNAFEHELSESSKHYKMYSDEFEFLWEQSERL